MELKNKTVAVGLSGGVDSSLAAWTLKQQGYNVVGITMSTWDNSIPGMPKIEGRSGCFGPNEDESIAEAQEIAKRMGIPHYTVPVSDEYKRQVLDYFRSEYRAGRTPNPCVRCNQTIKFGALLHTARQMGIDFDYFATGHYARLDFQSPDKPFLYRATDNTKDQSYFLSRLSMDQLSTVIFPLGGLRKEEVKAMARELGWNDYADKKESQDFLECGDYSVLFDESDNVPGDFVDLNGKVLGKHKGIVHYTIGQRKGLGIAAAEPLYVVRLDACRNEVVVGTRAELTCAEFRVTDLNWVAIPPQEGGIPCRVKIRSTGEPRGPATFEVEASGEAAVCRIPSGLTGVTPGQSAVFYEAGGDAVLCGGVIAGADEAEGERDFPSEEATSNHDG